MTETIKMNNTIVEPEQTKLEIEDDGLYLYKKVHGYDNLYTKRLLLTKDIFVEIYNKWIKGEDNNE